MTKIKIQMIVAIGLISLILFSVYQYAKSLPEKTQTQSQFLLNKSCQEVRAIAENPKYWPFMSQKYSFKAGPQSRDADFKIKFELFKFGKKIYDLKLQLPQTIKAKIDDMLVSSEIIRWEVGVDDHFDQNAIEFKMTPQKDSAKTSEEDKRNTEICLLEFKEDVTIGPIWTRLKYKLLVPFASFSELLKDSIQKYEVLK